MGAVCTSYKTTEHLAFLLLWFLCHCFKCYLYHGVVTSVHFPYVLLGCLIAKEGTEKKIPQALILNCCNIK